MNWIKENKDYPTILNNFIYLFEFVDSQCRINFVNKESESGIFESSMAIRMKQEYKLLLEEGKINHELLEMSSAHMFFQNIPSMVRKNMYIHLLKNII